MKITLIIKVSKAKMVVKIFNNTPKIQLTIQNNMSKLSINKKINFKGIRRNIIKVYIRTFTKMFANNYVKKQNLIKRK